MISSQDSRYPDHEGTDTHLWSLSSPNNRLTGNGDSRLEQELGTFPLRERHHVWKCVDLTGDVYRFEDSEAGMGHVAVQRRKKLTTRTNRCFLNGLAALNSFSCPISQFVLSYISAGGGVGCLV